MRDFVTGATGFLGTHLCHALQSAGHEVVPVGSRECDLTNPQALDGFNDWRFDRIFHLAAWTQAGDFCLKHPGEQWLINQQMNTNVLAWAEKRQPQAFLVSIGTSCAYSPDLELVEENYLEGRPIDSLFTYGMTKRMLRTGLVALGQQFGLQSLTLIPSTLYGTGYHTDGRQMHFIFDVILKIIRGKFLQTPVQLWGDGYQRRELIHVDDFVRVALRLAEERSADLVNVGTGQEFTIRHFAELVCRIVDFDPNKIEYDTTRYVGAKSKCVSIGHLKSLIPDLRLTPLETGLTDVVNWCVQHRDEFPGST